MYLWGMFHPLITFLTLIILFTLAMYLSSEKLITHCHFYLSARLQCPKQLKDCTGKTKTKSRKRKRQQSSSESNDTDVEQSGANVKPKKKTGTYNCVCVLIYVYVHLVGWLTCCLFQV